MLNIGDGAGALILYTEADLAMREIEISMARAADGPGTSGHTTHALVRERTTMAGWRPARPGEGEGGTAYAAVYDALPAGDYAIWLDGQSVATVTIDAAAVTRHRLQIQGPDITRASWVAGR